MTLTGRGAAASFESAPRSILLARPLTPEEERLFRNAAFANAEVRTDLGQYDESIRLYRALAERYQGRAESLHALTGALKNYSLMKDLKSYHETVRQMRATLESLDESAFDPSVSALTRPQWEQRLAEWGRWTGG